MDWDDLRYFLKVAETGGISPAGRVLQVNAATVGRHVEALEAALGQRLFHRTHQGYRLTDAGERLLDWSRRMEAEFAALQGALGTAGEEPAGLVTLATTEPLATGFVIPSLPALRRAHPALAIEIAADVQSANLSRREADVALRLAPPSQGNVVARRIGEVGYALYAAPDYLAARGAPSLENGFAGHDIVEWPLGYDTIPQVTWLRRLAPRGHVVLRSTSGATRQAAARAGIGIALLPCIAADRDPALAALRIAEQPPRLGLWTAAHAELAHLPRVRAVLDHLARAAAEQAAPLRGGAPVTASATAPASGSAA